MTSRPLRVLCVDDDPNDRALLVRALRRTFPDFEVVEAAGGAEAAELVKGQLFDAAIVDVRMPGMGGLDVLRAIKGVDAAIEVVMVTGQPDVPTAVEALREGAADYLGKPVEPEELRHRLGRLVERRFLRQEVDALRSRVGERPPAQELVGTSPPMAQLRETVARVAGTDSPLLIEGESGTGKELIAVAVHRLSPRSRGPFIPVNCSAIPADLLESEFFGHVRGAFSGAVADSLGLFRSAHQGTLFLDEVAEMPPALQAKLLRVLQDKAVRPVGATRSHTVDVRVIAATNRPVDQAVREGRLREDFFYRLSVVRIQAPPLRERRGDLPALVTHVLRQLNRRFGRDVTGLAPEAMAALAAYDFPGNVRELENLLEHAYAIGARGEITLADLPAVLPRSPALAEPPGPPEPLELPTLAEAERELILRGFRLHGNNRERVARALGISRQTLYRRLKEYRIE